MKTLKLFLFFVLVLISNTMFATTWDEPWQDKVIKEADYFVYANIISYEEDKGVTIEIIKSLGGEELKGTVVITDFYSLEVCSTSGGHGPEFHFGDIKECYFFLKKNENGEYCIATPTTGFDYLVDGKVHAAYRHSYHRALVPVDIYEKTMAAIFKNYHHQPFDKQFITDYVGKHLVVKPAGFEDNEIETFFAQHVALECVYHIRLDGFFSNILPFLKDTSNFHNQVSASRALIAYNTTSSKQELLKIVSDTAAGNFVQVICIWTLSEFKPTELKDQLTKAGQTASSEYVGFGGNIMDPRVCTSLPDVKSAIQKLVETL